MPYFRAQNGEVFSYETQQERDLYGAPDLVKMTQEEVDRYKNPPKTYQQELSDLNSNYQIDVDKFNRSFAIAYLSDGPSQESKQATIRAQYEVRKTQHAENVAALKSRYGV